jgi:hypothetical protein
LHQWGKSVTFLGANITILLKTFFLKERDVLNSLFSENKIAQKSPQLTTNERVLKIFYFHILNIVKYG